MTSCYRMLLEAKAKYLKEEMIISKQMAIFMVVMILTSTSHIAHAWDHPGHMTTAAIAYSEIERARPELMEKIGLLFLVHPVAGPFWVAAGAARGKGGRPAQIYRMCALGGRY